MSLSRYPAYKDSGVEWLGEVPGHWEVIRLKNVLQRRITDGPHTTPNFVDEGVPFLSVDGIQEGELRFDGCRYISMSDHEEYRRKALPQRDDLLMGKAASTGKIARVKVDFEFSIWSPLALIRLDPNASNPTFYEQSLKSLIVQAQIDNLCTANTQKNISMDDIPKLILTRPPFSEQTQIAAFLDRETAKIDALVAEQRRLMELLKEKRQAVISHAVTRGLNPDAPLKPSGIEWLGEVPEHWTTPAMYMRYSSELGKMLDSAKITGNHLVPYMRNVDVQWGAINFEDLPTMDIREDEYERYVVKPGDLLVCEGGEVGRAAIVPPICGVWGYQKALHRLRAFDNSEDSHFMYYTLLWAANTGIFERSGSSTIAHLTGEQLRKYRFPKPPNQEQKEIATFLEAESTKFDTLTTEAQRAIDLLQERRTALISAAVTGQIDVRGWQSGAEWAPT